MEITYGNPIPHKRGKNIKTLDEFERSGQSTMCIQCRTTKEAIKLASGLRAVIVRKNKGNYKSLRRGMEVYVIKSDSF